MAVETIRIDLLETSLTIQTDEDREYIETIVSYIKKKLAVIQSATLVQDPLKLAILSNIYAVDELFHAQKALETGVNSADLEYIEHAADRILLKIDSALKENFDEVE